MRLLVSSALAATLFVGGTHAACSHEFHNTYMLGEGAAHCSDFLQAMDMEREERVAHPVRTEPGYSTTYTDEFRRFGDFADGFLTGANVYEEDGMTGQDSDQWGRALWLENYCRSRPFDVYINALVKLRTYLVTQRH